MARSTVGIFEALRKNSVRQMQLLIESGNDVNARNGQAETPLMVALYRLRNKEERERVIQLLCDAEADVNARNGQGRTALMYACALDQADSVRLLLQQESCDVNQGDVSGVTPLMLTAALGHRASLSAIMEHARRGGRHFRLDTEAKDDSEFTAIQYASVSGNGGLADTLGGRSKTSPAPGVRLAGNNSAHSSSSNNKTANSNVRNVNNNNLKNSNKNTLKGRAGSNVQQPSAVRASAAGQEMEMVDMTPSRLALRDSNLPSMQQFGREVKAMAAASETNLVALRTTSSTLSGSGSRSGSRPASRSSGPAPRGHLSKSQDRAASRAGSRAASGGGGSHSVERPASRASRSRGSSIANSENDDLDLDLSSLRELMGTVREAAKEIREIVEPIQKEGRESREHAARAREAHRKAAHQQGRRHRKQRRNSDHQHQVQAEIHVISEINGRAIPPLPPAIVFPSSPDWDEDPASPPSTPPPPSQPRHPPPPPTAFLHVENEELSHTWPRQKGRSVSRDRVHRTLSGSGGPPAGGSISASTSPVLPPRYAQGAGPLFGAEHAYHPGPPQGGVDPGAARHEREILDKVVGRYGGPDPLVSAINTVATTPKSRQIIESRQRVMGVAREHWNAHQANTEHSGPRVTPPQSPPPRQSSTPLPQITFNQKDDASDEEDEYQVNNHSPLSPASSADGPRLTTMPQPSPGLVGRTQPPLNQQQPAPGTQSKPTVDQRGPELGRTPRGADGGATRKDNGPTSVAAASNLKGGSGGGPAGVVTGRGQGRPTPAAASRSEPATAAKTVGPGYSPFAEANPDRRSDADQVKGRPDTFRDPSPSKAVGTASGTAPKPAGKQFTTPAAKASVRR